MNQVLQRFYLSDLKGNKITLGIKQTKAAREVGEEGLTAEK